MQFDPDVERAALRAWLSTFYPFQRTWLTDSSRFGLTTKSRQIGASHSYAGAAVLWGLGGDTTTVISVGEREADEVVRKARKHAQILARLGSRLAVPDKCESELRMASGGRVIALPATSGGRSYSGHVILDEFGYHKDPERVWDGAAGTVMLGYKLRVLSTPNGIGNLFHHLVTDAKAHEGYRIHKTTLDDAIAQGYRVDIAECWKMARGDPRVFDQLFRCTFLDNDLQYISTELVAACTADSFGTIEGDTYGGIDVGRKNDRTVLLIIRRTAEGRLYAIAIERRSRTSDADLDALAALAFNAFKVKRLCIDATGMGAFPAERMQKTWGKTKVEAIEFTLSSKEDLATTLYQTMQERRLVLPRDPDLRDDICSIRRIVTSAGNVRYDAPTTDRGHADSAWALALGVHAASRPVPSRGVGTQSIGVF